MSGLANVAASVMSMFGGGVQQPQQQPQLPTPGNMNPATAATTQSTSSPQTAPNGVVPAGNNSDPNTASPLDGFKDLWNTPTTPTGGDQSLFNVNQEQLLAIARKTDFRPEVTPQQLAAITAGGEAAIPALMEVINSAVQMGYARSAEATTKLIEGGLSKAGYAKSTDIETVVKQQQLNSSLRESNPALEHPALQPMVSALRDTLVRKNPQATAGELEGMLNNYLTAMVGAIQAPQTQAQQAARTKVPKSENWEQFFSPTGN